MTAHAAYDNGYDTLVVPRPRSRRPTNRNLTDDALVSSPGGGLTTSAFSVNRFPTWLLSICDKVSELVQLPTGWDGHDGRPVKLDVAAFAIQFLFETLEPDGPEPQIVPLSYGGVQLEWHEQQIDLEIEVVAPNRMFVSFEDHKTGEEFEKEFSTNYAEVARVLRLLSLRKQG